MKKGQIADGVVVSVVFPNKGIVCAEDGSRVMVKNSIPGQRVRFAVNKTRGGRLEGRLLEVLQPAPQEVEADCPHFGACGGCIYRTLPYAQQLELKSAQVQKLIEDAGEGYDFLGILPSPRIDAYRNKMEFSFGNAYKDGPLALGMHRRGSFYDIVTVDGCRIVDEDFRRILSATLSYFQEAGTPFLHRGSHMGYLRHLLVRKAARTGEILVDLVTTTQKVTIRQNITSNHTTDVLKRQIDDSDSVNIEAKCSVNDTNENAIGEKRLLHGWVESLCALPLDGTLRGILHTRNDSVADVIKDEGTETLYGEDFFYEEILGLKFCITPFSFFQTNSYGAEVLYRTARSFLLDGDETALADGTVYDLYSGTGTIAQMLAPVCREVIGVEIVEEAVEAARENASLNGLDNCHFLAGDVLRVLDTIPQKPDAIVLDPPRDGIHPKALTKILAYGVERIVYISCKPTSLARDLEAFYQHGYVLCKVQCVDLFPGTYHVETVALLHRSNEPDSRAAS